MGKFYLETGLSSTWERHNNMTSSHPCLPIFPFAITFPFHLNTQKLLRNVMVLVRQSLPVEIREETNQEDNHQIKKEK